MFFQQCTENELKSCPAHAPLGMHYFLLLRYVETWLRQQCQSYACKTVAEEFKRMYSRMKKKKRKKKWEVSSTISFISTHQVRPAPNLTYGSSLFLLFFLVLILSPKKSSQLLSFPPADRVTVHWIQLASNGRES